MTRHVPLLLLATLCVAACSDTEPRSTVGDPATQPVAPPVTSSALSAFASTEAQAAASVANGVVMDFRRQDWWEMPEVPGSEQNTIIRLVVGEAVPKGTSVTARINGSFTAAGLQQQAVIVVPEGPSTMAPFPKPSTLAVMQGGEVVAKHTFSKEDASWQWPRKAVDLDGDGVDEILVTGGWMQMGESGTSLAVVSMAGGDFTLKQVVDKVAYDDCSASVDQPGKGHNEALVLRASGDGKLQSETYTAPCGKPGADGNAPPPAEADYKPVG